MRSGQLLGMQGASSGEDLGEVVVQLDGVYASFDASLRVPPNARYGEHSIMLLQSDSSGVGYVDAGSSYGGTRTLTSALLAVADPRPPTVELTVSTPGTRHLPPNGTVLLKVRTASLSGVPLREQSVTLRWRRTRRPPLPSLLLLRRPRWVEEKAEDDVTEWTTDGTERNRKADGEEDGDEDGEGVGGEEQVLTGDDGEATLHWRPARRDGRPVRLELGDEFALQFEYMGPTRERREASLQVPVALSELAVHLVTPATALAPALPLHPFELQVELTKLGALGGAAVGGRRVRLSLHRVPEGEEEEEDGERSTSAARKMADEDGDEPRQWLQNVPPAMLPSFVTAPASEAARPPSCVLDTTSLGAVSSASACAPFSLPSMGHYLALACLLEDSESVIHETRLLEDSESTPPAAGAAAAGAAAAAAVGRIEMCSGVLFGRTAAQWRASPLSEYLPRAVKPTLEKTRYALGEAPRVRVTNPFQSALPDDLPDDL